MYSNYIHDKSWLAEDFAKFNRSDELYFEAELKRCGLVFSPSTRIFEVGFGNGVFAGWVLSKRITYSGSEVLDELVARGSKQGLDVFKDDEIEKNILKSSIDLIVAWDVFEHINLDDLIQLFKVYKDYLKPKGMILARIPSGDSPFAMSIYNGDITHKILLGSGAVKQIANECGYKVREIAFPKLPVFGLGFRRMLRRSVILVSQVVLGRFINIIFHNNDQCIISPNMIFLLQKL